LVPVYSGAEMEAKKKIIHSLEDPLSSLKSVEDAAIYFGFIKNCPKGSELLSMRCIYLIAQLDIKLDELVSLVKELYKTKIQDIRIIASVLHLIEPQDIIAEIPSLIKLNSHLIKESLTKILKLSRVENKMKSIEILLFLHKMVENDQTTAKDVAKAISACFELPNIFHLDDFIECLNLIVASVDNGSSKRFPIVFMRTLLICLATYSRSVVNSIKLFNNIFSPNISKNLQKRSRKCLFDNKMLIEGFELWCIKTFPHCLSILQMTSESELKMILSVRYSL
ncbi:MAG: hypothetical protein MHPSP_002593, partial [Paramarteilia canceri]